MIPQLTVGYVALVSYLSKASRKTKNALNKAVRGRKKIATASKEKYEIEIKIDELNRYDAHPRRPRCAYFVELIQVDASPHVLFNDMITHLHLVIDDATDKIVVHISTQETLRAYYEITH